LATSWEQGSSFDIFFFTEQTHTNQKTIIKGLARLMDLLAEENEIVRNEVLLVLIGLTHGNQELNKIMAFEGSFDTLLAVIADEDEGSVIATDCRCVAVCCSVLCCAEC